MVWGVWVVWYGVCLCVVKSSIASIKIMFHCQRQTIFAEKKVKMLHVRVFELVAKDRRPQIQFPDTKDSSSVIYCLCKTNVSCALVNVEKNRCFKSKVKLYH